MIDPDKLLAYSDLMEELGRPDEAAELRRDADEARWVPCDEALPAVRRAVLACRRISSTHTRAFVAMHSGRYGWMSTGVDGEARGPAVEVTHWQPLPWPPDTIAMVDYPEFDFTPMFSRDEVNDDAVTIRGVPRSGSPDVVSTRTLPDGRVEVEYRFSLGEGHFDRATMIWPAGPAGNGFGSTPPAPAPLQIPIIADESSRPGTVMVRQGGRYVAAFGVTPEAEAIAPTTPPSDGER